MSASSLTLADFIERLATPASSEWSVLTGTPVLAVDATGPDDARTSADALSRAVGVLGTLPCPSVALIGERSSGPVQRVLAAFDVVVTTRAELDAVVAAVTRTPLAAATLVHVLRAGAVLTVAEALTLESLGYATLQAGPEHARWLAARPAAAHGVTDGDPVRVELENDRLIITLDRPARHNAFSARMRDALCAALALAHAEPDLAVVLRGAGPSFSSGGDLDEFGTRPDPTTAHLVRMTRSPARLLAAIAPRLRAEVHGACLGAGSELAAFAGHVIATSDAVFQLPEVAMGLIPGAGGTASITRRIGRQRTAGLALTGRRLDAATALGWGLIDAVAEAAKVS
ncbi:MAG: enoyl-CoA hydratase/isomerase family protein [Candidatus Binatia bacterium]